MINQEKSLLQRILPHGMAILAFLIIAMIYFMPVFQGKVLHQHDTTQYSGMAQEMSNYYYNEGITSEWTGSMFSGMPSYQIGVFGGGTNFLDYLEKPFKALGNTTAGPMFMGMLMAYLMFIILGFRPMIAAMGAIAYSLSSYNIIILSVGHVTKAWAIAYMPLIVAGLLSLFRKNISLVAAGLMVALGLGLQIKSNHPQITYYTGLLCLFIFIYYAVVTIKNKEIKTLLKSSAVMLIAVVLGLCCNLSNIYGNYEMSKTSIRGKSDLQTALAPKIETNTAGDEIDRDKEYAFNWSYGIGETMSLLIPNINGGSTDRADESLESYKILVNNGLDTNQAKGISKYTKYWGEQPSIAGPVYFGAIIIFLFVLGMILIKNKIKWVLLAATIFFIFLSWGHNFASFNDWFYYHFPLYGKFRAITMSLVIPALTMLIVAIWGLKEFLDSNRDKKQLTKALYISAGATAFICLLALIAPTIFTNFHTASDLNWKDQFPAWYYSTVMEDRHSLLSGDALRSFLFILAAAVILWFSLKAKNTKVVTVYIPLILAVLVLADLWSVDKRYLNHNDFQEKDTYNATFFKKRPVDEYILRDTHPSYRVLDASNLEGDDTFVNALPSYYHKNIGGYHAAKLKRYQEMIEFRLGSEVSFVRNAIKNTYVPLQNAFAKAHQEGNQVDPSFIVTTMQDSIQNFLSQAKIMNMLNTKYLIYQAQLPAIENTHAMGNAWFVKEYKLVETADQELMSLNDIDPAVTAVLNKRDEAELQSLQITPDSSASIVLTEYKPNKMTYKSKASSEQLAVFSEIFYKEDGWQAYIDGVAAPHYRADWTLRAMRVPAGEHEIVFKYEPHTYWTVSTIGAVSSALLILILIGVVVMPFIRKKKEIAA